MSGLLHALKPGASRRAQATAAALLWTAVGLGLLTAGSLWSFDAGGAAGWIFAGAGTLLGLIKGRLVLFRAADRIYDRIRRRQDGSCLGGAFSWRSWLLVLVMMSAGIALRRSPLPRPWLGLIYVAVGVALLCGAARVWQRGALERGAR